MKISVVGTGYVGLVVGTCLAETGNEVICVDVDQEKIALLNAGRSPLYEPGLSEMIQRNVKEQRLRFTAALAEAVQDSRVVFIAVGTPTGEDGRTDLTAVLGVAGEIAGALKGYKIIVNKSTVPVGTGDRIYKEMKKISGFQFDVASNPEFLKEGAAVDDFMRPDRVIIGTDDEGVAKTLRKLYAPFTRTGAPVLVMSRRSAEMTKYAANTMLASRISLMNEIANLCELTGADVNWVRQGVGLDRRIGTSFLFPGLGYGGSCFPKDLRSLIQAGQSHDYDPELIRAVDRVNERQKRVIGRRVLEFYSEPSGSESPAGEVDRLEAGPLAGRTFAVWGLAFKPRTDDVRESAALVIIEELLGWGGRIQAFDPEAMDQARLRLGDRIQYAGSNYEALRGADALILATEWNVFRNPDFEKMKRLLEQPVVFDGRSQYDPREMAEKGFVYFGIGIGRGRVRAGIVSEKDPG